MIRLSKELVIRLHEMLIEKSGGSKGIRDLGLLESSLDSPFQTFDGAQLYPDDFDKIISIGYSLIKNHSFIDGNKRIGVLVLSILLKENGFNVIWSDDQLIKIGLDIASGKMNKDDLKKYIKSKLL